MNQKQLKLVKQWVTEHREQLIEDITTLVNIPSVSNPQDNDDAPFGDNCKKVLQTIEKMGVKYGLTLQNADSNCCQLWLLEENPLQKETIGIWGHLDVVPEESAWHFPAFDATYKNGFLIGRGTGDNKGPCVGIMYALRCLMECGFHLPYSVALCYGTSEENGMMDVRRWMQRHAAPDFNLVADCGFPLCYGEKGRLDILFQVKRENGLENLSMFAGSVTNMIPEYASCKVDLGCEPIEGYGVSTHVAFPENSVNAIQNLSAKLIKEHRYKNDSQRRLFEFLNVMTKDGYGRNSGISMEGDISGPLVGTITWIRTGDQEIEMKADYRYPIFANTSQEQGRISDGAEVLEKLNRVASQYGVEMNVLENSRPSYFPKEHPFAQSLLKSYYKYTGSSTEPFVMSGGSYARILPNAVAFGMSAEGKKIYHEIGWPPGMGDYHQANESVYVDEILEGIVIYCKTLMELKIK